MDKVSTNRVRWFRNTNNRKIGGVCSGLSDMLDVDPTLVRFIFLMLCITPVPIITAYLAAWFIVPKKGDINVRTSIDSTTTNTTSGKELLTERR